MLIISSFFNSHFLISFIWLPQPITLIVVPSWKKAQNVFEIVEKFTDMNLKSKRPSRPVTSQKQIRPIVLYAGGTEDSEHVSLHILPSRGYSFWLSPQRSCFIKYESV